MRRGDSLGPKADMQVFHRQRILKTCGSHLNLKVLLDGSACTNSCVIVRRRSKSSFAIYLDSLTFTPHPKSSREAQDKGRIYAQKMLIWRDAFLSGVQTPGFSDVITWLEIPANPSSACCHPYHCLFPPSSKPTL